jgi:DNA-binding PadR family transcriptional regulator
MSLKHAILGFLSFKPMSGYDLKKAFDNSVRHFWPANQSQIYRTLAELEENEFVEKEVIPREERLDLKVYRVTEAGGEELRRWLSTPLPPREDREPFLVQVYFGGLLTDGELLRVLEHEIEEARQRLEAYREIYAAATQQTNQIADERAVFLAMLTLEYGIEANATFLRWLNRAVERIRTGDYRTTDFAELIGETK